MQALLGKISSLDPEASQALRVIACFDELTIGKVNTRGLLSAAAALTGCDAGYRSEAAGRTLLMTPKGEPSGQPVPVTPRGALSADGMTVWLEREGEPHANDEIVLERLALAIRIRHGHGMPREERRELAIVLDEHVGEEERLEAAGRLGLTVGASYRVLAAPLFAVWDNHPGGPEDVLTTPFGHIHALVLRDCEADARATPLGIGAATPAAELHHAFRSALVALRLCHPPETPMVRVDDYGALITLLADVPTSARVHDVEILDVVMQHPWAHATIDALVRSSTLRQAARLGGVHHSTMKTRLEVLRVELGYDPMDGLGHTRLGMAFLLWRLQNSRVLALPAPATQQRDSVTR